MPAQSRSAVLIVLDGFGIGKDSPFNAINNAKMPFYRDLLNRYPHSQLLTHGQAVGLPDGVMGNSEVGHMTMGAGRIIYQDLTRISKAIREKTFFKNEVIRKTLEAGAQGTGRVHFMGLLSDGGVHSHLDHLRALLDLSQEMRIPEVSVHVFLDGRDTPPNSGVGYVKKLLEHPAFQATSGTRARIASVMGRYFAMDRDKRWDRVQKAYNALTGQTTGQASGPNSGQSTGQAGTAPGGNHGALALEVIERSYQAGVTDEFVEPVCLDASAAIQPGDSIFFFNFRADRAREISQALGLERFTEFERGTWPKPSAYGTMTIYDKNLPFPAAFEPQSFKNIFGDWLEQKKRTQFRIAETEKYAHVTFFFNGGREQPFQGEERLLIPSPREVATYDLQPEMSAFQVAEQAAQKISSRAYDFVLMNFANADMVGHTGNYAAAVKAMEALDQCLAQVVGAAEKNGSHVLLTADHGNAEEMLDENNHIHTQHTLNPVPAIWVAPGSAIAPRSERVALRDGGLQDIMPTLCQLMNLPLPDEVTGKSLIPKTV